MWLQVLCFLLILTSFLCSTAHALTFEEEKKAAKTLFENIDRKQLSDSLTTCQHTHQHQGEAECRRLKYVKLVDDDLEKLKTPRSSLLNDEAPAVPKVRDMEESYQSLFENYVVQNVPFKGKLMGKSSAVTAMSEAALRCLETGERHNTGDLPLRDCLNSDDMRTAVQIPTVAYNSYNVRLASATTESSSVDLASHWPSLLQVPSSLAVPLSRAAPRSCPANMHLLLWGPSAHLTARLFPRDLAAHALSPSPGSDLLHHVQFRAPSDQQEGLYVDAPLMSGGDDYLFVPHDHLVSLAQQQANDVPAAVFQMCFFDASNVNYVRESLAVAALVLDPPALRALSLLQSGDNGLFDFNMTRKAPAAALSYSEYVNYPRGGGEGVQEGSSSDITTAKSKNKPRGRDRSKGGANNFRGNE